MKKEEYNKVSKQKVSIRGKLLNIMIGFIIGIIIAIILAIIFYSSGYIEKGEVIKEKDKIEFTVKDVHLNIKNDFAIPNIPSYTGDYCSVKYLDKYGKNPESCSILKVTTYARINPLVKDITCLCYSD